MKCIFSWLWGRIEIFYYTNQDICRIPGNATQAKAGLSGTWSEPIDRSSGVPDKSRSYLNLFYIIHFPCIYFSPIILFRLGTL